MEKKFVYREFFPGYMGHIPLKNEAIGMTVGGTNKFIKSYLTKEPDYEQILVPSIKPDYTYYNRGYFNENMAKTYALEEDKIFSNRSKDARSWICGYKHQLYPEHIPGYTGHVHGIETTTKKGSNINGMSYAKASSIAVKGAYCKDIDLPVKQRYISEMKDRFVAPKIRSDAEERELQRENEKKKVKEELEEKKDEDPCYFGLSDAFKTALNYNNKTITEVPYIVGYGGFRPRVYAGNRHGKSFRTIALQTLNELKNKKK